MFSRLRDFLHRHRRKFLVAGSVAAGLYFLSRYTENKILTWHDAETRKFLSKQKKKEHFDKTKQTAVATVSSLAGSITKIISEELDHEELLRAIREEPKNKKLLWNQVKVVGFARCISTVYVASLTSLGVHAHLMVLGARTYSDSQKPHPVINVDLQHKYLENIQYFVEVGIPDLVSTIFKAAECVVEKIPLDRKLTLPQLEGIFKEIVLILKGESSHSQSETSGRESLKLNRFSTYLCRTDIATNNNNDESHNLLKTMVLETADVIDASDFTNVVDTLVEHGLNYMLDRIADRYSEAQEVSSPNKPAINPLSNGVHPHSEASSSHTGHNEHSEHVFYKFSSVAVPVAKLIPHFCGLLFPAFSLSPGHLLPTLSQNEKAERLGCNIYEAFSGD